ncbi:hypothetical protein EDD36DRAFT_480259 [Exophiala viscosa]|uniref:NAD-dependent epimerase/dehydratase domain-containing protein n=1 Tax=Exophiala viscosa TaxID=2486360 RepID=A0AAN6IHK3_9EURO|nr:hypothetical protein EDD36DRAFT_480259 [Exophiala viscosa]
MATPVPRPNGKTVLLTGMNGFIASNIALQLLDRGYIVRGTSRKADTVSRLLKQPLFNRFANIIPARVQHVIVPDISAKAAFDEAVQGVDAIIHTASPIDFSLETVSEFLDPAIGGVQAILCSAYHENEAAIRNGQVAPITSFVLTSSIAAIFDQWRFPPHSESGARNHAYSEVDWNESAEAAARESEAEGRPLIPMVAYAASKVAAERAMWDFIQVKSEEAGRIQIVPACSSINPGVAIGPPVLWPDTPERLNETLMPMWKIWSGEAKATNTMPPQIGSGTFIDVRDVARLHVWCMENTQKSSSQRYMITNGKASSQAVADLLREGLVDEHKVAQRIIIGDPGKGYTSGFGFSSNEPSAWAMKAYEALDRSTFRSFGQCIRDTVLAFRERWPEYGY